MYAYVDETGNTGQNLFDPDQPYLITAGLMTHADFDSVYGARIQKLSKSCGLQELHGAELGLDRIEKISRPLLSLLRSASARFFVSQVEKRYLAITKLVDTVFDSNENRAVPWHSYNLKPLRLLLVFKVAHLVDDSLLQAFWASIMHPEKAEAYLLLVTTCRELL